MKFAGLLRLTASAGPVPPVPPRPENPRRSKTSLSAVLNESPGETAHYVACIQPTEKYDLVASGARTDHIGAIPAIDRVAGVVAEDVVIA